MNRLAVMTMLALCAAFEAKAQTIILDNFNSGTATGSVISSTTWTGGNVVQNATSITVGGTAKDDNGWGKFNTSINATGMNYVTITAQRDSGNAAASFVIEFQDTNLNSKTFSVSTFSFTSGALTQVQIPISSWGTVDPTQITGWTIGGGTTGISDFRMTFDNLSLSASAIPEPSTYAFLVGLGSLAFAAWHRRTRRAKC